MSYPAISEQLLDPVGFLFPLFQTSPPPESLPGIAKPAIAGMPYTMHPRRRNKESCSVRSNTRN